MQDGAALDWAEAGAGYNPKYRSTVWSIVLLAQLGASVVEDARISRACTYLLENALASGGQAAYISEPLNIYHRPGVMRIPAIRRMGSAM